MGIIILCLDLQPLKQNWWKQIARLGVYLISTAWKKSGKGQNWRVEFHSMKKKMNINVNPLSWKLFNKENR